jgi:phosphoserine phosphatase
MSEQPLSPEHPFATILFDCDSTLTRIEGIDALADGSGPEVAARVAEATRRAMDGEVPLEKVFGERLDALRPTRDDLQALGTRYVRELTPGARETIATLRRLGKTVGIVSGGLLPAVRVLAAELGLPARHVHAVDVCFAANGAYASFVEGPLARSGGKPALVTSLLDELPRPIGFVGDGITDLEVRDVVDRFVGFGGVVSRTAVRTGASPWFVDDPDLRAILPILLTGAELRGV